nr:type IV secretion system protein VirB10 [Paraburkholderia sp. NMBU_R16]
MPNRDFLLIAGTTIPCVQGAKIVTDYPGMTTCHVAKDVYSVDGKVLLIERGSEVVGEQRQALMQGQARIFVIWTRLTTPDGVVVQLDSPAADALGGSGLPAYVDTHFWTRFGGAIMVSLISDAGQALSSMASNSGGGSNQIQFNNTSSAGEQVAAETLRNTINVPPTAYSKYGSMTTIFVARDIDFSDVYELAKP